MAAGAGLVPGALLELLQRPDGGERRPALLQVIAIVPALAGGDLYSSQGYHLKVSDSSHAAYAALSDDGNDLIKRDELQVGQFVYVDRLDAASPVPVLRGVRPVPGRHPCIGTPEDVPARPPPEKKQNAAPAPDVKKASSLSRSLSSLSKQSSSSLEERRDTISKTRPANAVLSKSGSFDKSNGAAKVRLMEKAASAIKARKPSSERNAPRSIHAVVVAASEPKALRKSWEGSAECKPKDSSTPRKSEQHKHEARSSSAPRRRLPAEEDTAAQVNDKKPPPNAAAASDKLGKEKSTAARKMSAAAAAEAPADISLSNLVRVPASSRKLTASNASWSSLPSPLGKLGKEVFKHRDSAEAAAVEAVQEASAAETLLRCLGAYAELRSSADADSPYPAVEKFLALHATLTYAGIVAESLARTAARPDAEEESANAADAACSEHRRLATSWVHAALATDLCPFTLYRPKLLAPPVSVAVAVASGQTKGQGIVPAPKPSEAAAPSASADWVHAEGTDEMTAMARALREEMTTWFLTFVERFLDADRAAAPPRQSDRERVAGMLSQLKRVNGWLDDVSQKNGGATEADATPASAGESTAAGGVPKETVERLRKKIYEYLLAHVESAAVALGGGGIAAGSAAPAGKGGGDRDRRP